MTRKMNSAQSGIGIVGVGLLGSALAARLASHQFNVSIYDTDDEAIENAVSRGAIGCTSAADLFESCRAVWLSLPTSAVVSSVLDEVDSHLTPEHVVFDATTGAPRAMIDNARRVTERGASYFEANVAGSSAQLRKGEAVLFIAGSQDDLPHQQPLLNTIAERHFFLGPVGSASRMKLIHNLVLGLNRAVLSEGLVFAEAMGLNPQIVLDILRQSPAYSRIMDTKGQKMVSGDFDPQAKLAQHLKDVNLILDEANRAGLATPLSDVHRQILELAINLGLGDSDNSAIIEAFRSQPDEGEL